MTKTKKNTKDIPVAVTEEVVTDLEESPVKEVVYTFQTLGYVFMVGAIAAAVAWFYYVAKWQKHHSDEIDIESVNLTPYEEAIVRADQFTICFQALVAACLLYFVFRHHYRHH